MDTELMTNNTWLDGLDKMQELTWAHRMLGSNKDILLQSKISPCRCMSRDLRKGILSKHEAAMLQYNSALGLLFMGGALHRGCDLLM